MTKWFKRGDGVFFSADEGSPSYKMMESDGAFEEISDPTKSATPNKTVTSSAKKPTAKKPTAKKPDEAEKSATEAQVEKTK